MFNENQKNCLKILPSQIERIVKLAAKHKESAPELLDVLGAVITVEELNLPLRRNQEYVMKAVMQNLNDITYILEKSIDER